MRNFFPPGYKLRPPGRWLCFSHARKLSRGDGTRRARLRWPFDATRSYSRQQASLRRGQSRPQRVLRAPRWINPANPKEHGLRLSRYLLLPGKRTRGVSSLIFKSIDALCRSTPRSRARLLGRICQAADEEARTQMRRLLDLGAMAMSPATPPRDAEHPGAQSWKLDRLAVFLLGNGSRRGVDSFSKCKL